MPTLSFNIQIDGQEPDTLRVIEYSGRDSFSLTKLSNGVDCNGFRFEFQLASRQPNLSANDIVDRCVDFEIVRDGVIVQRLNGIVRQFGKGDTGHHHTFYTLTMVPALERLALRRNSRIFQLKTVPEILSVLLQEMGINEYAFVLKNEHIQREFCVQYRESDLDFLHRLAAEEGMVYSFVHEQGKHTLLFTDANDGLLKLSQPIPYNSISGGVVEQPFINTFSTRVRSEVSHNDLQDYSFKKPTYTFAQNARGTKMDYQRADVYEHFDFPGRFKDDASGTLFNTARLAYLRRDARTALGKSNHAGLIAGKKFDLQEHITAEVNREWLVVCVEHVGKQPQALEEEGGSGETTYSNKFKVIPTDYVWQAEPTVKPQVDGPMVATVAGPEGEDIYCDEYGRVKVHFHWDRYSNNDENSSCWVRVSQGWAGKQYGMIALPRVGHEVIVSFLNGDPDQPIITGRTYHATNVPPYSLPEHKTKTAIRTETYQGLGFNELSFEDQADKERIYVHAQKDFDIEVKNDHSLEIKHDKHLTVENDQFELTKNNRHLTVQGELRERVLADKSVNIGGGLQQKVKSKTAIDAGDEVHLKAGNKIVLDAGSAITIKAGGSFVKVDAGGVHVVGSAINLNSGGSAGSGSGFGGVAPVLPLGLEALVAPQNSAPLVYSPIESLVTAAKLKLVAVGVCLKREGETSCVLCATKEEEA
ncbi:type VI secretion system tip protein VgrG [Vibrio tubiashii]|uniref:type VI secretion system tip protein TssI/VgrG n=1 Tax=Vibrio tubiashii TaxID=29498 RepID=UPI001EFD9447|nr:type VI secretion system tip protein TssI/VgrG [Vibrio tubiashii]MCG9582334.1 type VI secretion system tip protein VgrG [Vibrio tubiashii]MCG9615925.1 type VI secretion system tip protein VgrG [Vibrio tubiashii]MCG9688579.1 type VI secretion system tip protein VgrG [Vibrio tubiashii]